MKDIKKFVNEEIEAFLQQNTNTSIVAWGCSEKTKEILSTKAIKINLIIDSNPALWGTKFMGIPVYSFSHINLKNAVESQHTSASQIGLTLIQKYLGATLQV